MSPHRGEVGPRTRPAVTPPVRSSMLAEEGVRLRSAASSWRGLTKVLSGGLSPRS